MTTADTAIKKGKPAKAYRQKRAKKRLVLGLLALAIFIAAALLAGIWYVLQPGLERIAAPLPLLVGAVFALLVLLAAAGWINTIFIIKGWPALSVLYGQTYHLINMLFPLAVRLGRLFGITRRQLEGSFIAVSNVLFQRRGLRVPANRLLVVTPHCLQLASCPRKITRDPHNCKRCGGCDIGTLVTMADEMGFHFFVATGGTLARQIVRDTRPQAVLAIACERDLMSGIQDVYPLPAVGVLNIRPNGPCYNTHVDIDELKAALAAIIEPAEPASATAASEEKTGTGEEKRA